MGRNLHYTIPRFLHNALDNHKMVRDWKRIDHPSDDNDFIYNIRRTGGLSDIVLHASDDYRYLLTDYFQKPEKIGQGAFILIARPEGDYAEEVVDIASQDEISIGKFSALMGALYRDDHWNYIPKERKE
ncbi:hypothetical protein L8R98_08790 [Vibrio splendidus]|uniref:hypothetical protein n=2 Tax=Vibrio splendidus TaxID=29497 RepID=UPI002468AEBD|nr:hypothetical protein [Vibrio splendidus]MDH5976872.1 hypothetical protein [Vibrio splendidus]